MQKKSFGRSKSVFVKRTIKRVSSVSTSLFLFPSCFFWASMLWIKHTSSLFPHSPLRAGADTIACSEQKQSYIQNGNAK